MQDLIGPAAQVLATVRHLLETRFKEKVAILLDGDPGVGKTLISDLIAFDLAGTPHAIERVNGQSLTVDSRSAPGRHHDRRHNRRSHLPMARNRERARHRR